MKVSGSTFIVTGGASGLGLATVEHLCHGGANVVVADLNVASHSELPEGSVLEVADVCNENSIRHVVRRAVERFGALHGVVNCAGILGASRVVGREGPHDLALFSRVIQVNLVGTFNVVRLAAAEMTKTVPNESGERGVIINTSSISAFEGQIGQAAYAASKGGVASMTLPIARELAKFGIRIVAVAPGVFRTPMIDAAPEAVQQSLEQQVVFPPRLGNPLEFASFVKHIIENPMLNGSVMRLDGAVRLSAK